MKFKLKTIRQVFKKFGNNISVDGVQLKKPTYNRLHRNSIYNGYDELQLISVLSSTHKSLARLLKSSCLKCGSNYKVEMHHIRKMSDINKTKSDINYIMSKAKRKQIPLCRKCHMETH